MVAAANAPWRPAPMAAPSVGRSIIKNVTQHKVDLRD